MNPTSSHQEVELLPAAALEILEGEDLGRVLAHARECAECARRLESYRAVAAALAIELPPESLEAGRSARLRDRLLIRARSDPPAIEATRHAARPRSQWGGIDRWSGWGVAAGLAGVLLVHHGFHRPLAYGWVVAGVAVILLVAVAVYGIVQRDRLSVLERRLAQLERHEQDASGP